MRRILSELVAEQVIFQQQVISCSEFAFQIGHWRVELEEVID